MWYDLGMPTIEVQRTIRVHTCAVCGHTWEQRDLGRPPLRCNDRARCGTHHWREGKPVRGKG